MESGLYEGAVVHERLTPIRHRFQDRLFLAYLDLEELPGLIAAGVVSDHALSLAAFRRGDHLGTPAEPLDRTIRRLVRDRTGHEPGGSIRVLAQLSCLGASFSPLSLFYCFGESGETIEAVVAEVSNTPWFERHAYVLGDETIDPAGHRHAKEFHVSPFMPMDVDYRFRFSPPSETLRVEIENCDRVSGECFFRAGLTLRRHELTRGNVNRMTFRYPLQPLRITAAIYFQAFQLWRRRCPYYPHPHRPPNSRPSTEHAAIERPSP